MPDYYETADKLKILMENSARKKSFYWTFNGFFFEHLADTHFAIMRRNWGEVT